MSFKEVGSKEKGKSERGRWKEREGALCCGSHGNGFRFWQKSEFFALNVFPYETKNALEKR